MEKYKHILTLLSLIALVFLIFGGTIGHYFNSDDYLAIHHALRNPTASPAQALTEFTKPSWGLYYRPLIKFFLEAAAKGFGMWAGGYHLISLICYAILCAEVYIIALLLTNKWPAAAAAAVVFMASGSHGEAIFWISSLNGVVENVITLASLILFILWRQKNRGFLRPLSVLLFVFALFTKESAISLPIILILYDFLLGGEIDWTVAAKRAAKSCWPFVAAGAAFILVRSLVMRQADLPPPLVTFQLRMLVAGPWHSVVMTLSPINWARALTWFDEITRTRVVLYLLITSVLLALTITPLVLRRYRIAFLTLWILAGAAPMFALGLAPSERHVVFSSAGAAILVAVVFLKLAQWMSRGSKPSYFLVNFVLVAAFVAPSLHFLKQTQRLWKQASGIANSVLEQTMNAHPSPENHSTFFFLNVPDSIGGALVFRFGNMDHAIRLSYGNDTLKTIRIATPDRVAPDMLVWPESAYFTIAAMGGHIYAPGEQVEGSPQAARWKELDRLGILEKNSRYIKDWERYGASPFLIYGQDNLTPAAPSELRTVLENLYSLR